MQEEDLLVAKRIQEAAERAYQTNSYGFTGFLGLAEQSVFHELEKQLSYVGYSLWGGMELAERQMLRFGSGEQLDYEEPFPIVCIRVEPYIQKFADALSHRDFLGSLMNLGIERDTMGDIVVEENIGYVFCTQTMAPYITEHLDKVKHTHVKCTITEEPPTQIQKELLEKTIQVASERIDGILAKVYGLSRGESLELFRQKLVYVNGRLCENNSYSVKPQDVLVTRGYGKCIYQGGGGLSKKGKLNATVLVYGK